jgi:hypothetical protein
MLKKSYSREDKAREARAGANMQELLMEEAGLDVAALRRLSKCAPLSSWLQATACRGILHMMYLKAADPITDHSLRKMHGKA